MFFRKFRKKRNINALVDPDEIFLDSKNLQNFDRQQFEGRIEQPIPRITINLLGASFLLITLVFLIRLSYLQIENGDMYRERSEENTLKSINIFTERGIIYDRNMKELAWNQKTDSLVEISLASPDPKEDLPYIRTYLSPGFSHVLGYVSYPAKDAEGNYWKTEFEGINGLEKEYHEKIKGENGSKMIETDAKGTIHSFNIVNAPKEGDDLVTSLDSRIQAKLFSSIQELSETNGFTGGAGIIMDVQNGEIISSTSFPEYDSEILSLGKDTKQINEYIHDERKFFLNRTVSGLYTPGSIIKPFFSLGALAENVIDPSKKILSTGSISIPNPYFPDQKTVFKDWRVNGWTNMAEALAVSSDVYFYEIGGGFEDQKGLGILNLEKYAKLFGFDQKTGIDLAGEVKGTIPSPAWKLKNFGDDPWRIGNTYHTSIGQYGFQVTPLEAVRATAAIANFGKMLTPHFIMGDKKMEEKFETIDLKKEYYDVVHDGMRQAVTYGTAVSLNVPYVKVVAKTGTAEIGVAKKRVNSWVIGFFPYENPKFAFTIVMESGPAINNVNATSVMRKLLDWMSVNTPEYFDPA
ncbi:hypothetical protein A3A99_00610 [Candidatus Nomurabacteria bacterium RIFCSPLOWO2_01_FULL_41_18]|nr:MAG: hypothetical protein A3A99_00610 [Candidatus Nomurabacteria bacterium RIFCSPLOWO2_01_FULL_41_18]